MFINSKYEESVKCSYSLGRIIFLKLALMSLMRKTDKEEDMFENDEHTDLKQRTAAERAQLCPS